MPTKCIIIYPFGRRVSTKMCVSGPEIKFKTHHHPQNYVQIHCNKTFNLTCDFPARLVLKEILK